MDAILPDGHGSVRLATAPEPEPAPDEALVAVAAYSINRGETFLLESPRPGWRPGKDVAGVVIAAAADGSGPSPGTRVVGHVAGRGWAERVPVPTSALAALPDSISTTAAAALPLAGLTALRLLRSIGSLLGRSLLVTGASGGVGHYLAEIAVGSGATVTAVTATDRRGARLRALGAHTVTDPAAATGPFDVGLESVGGASFTALRRLVRPDGRIIWFGEASRTPVTIDFFDWVDGTAAAPIEQFDYTCGGADGPDLATLVALVAAGRLHPEIDGVRPWQQTAAVIADLRGRRVRGNAVLTITDDRRAA
jgi:NADPH:quinone reductase-like Zn-dependent oxidoreductase